MTRTNLVTSKPTPRREWSSTRKLIVLALFLLVGFLWTQNTFDNFLWRVHLNHSDCATNAFGATFCGDDLKSYQQRLDNLKP